MFNLILRKYNKKIKYMRIYYPFLLLCYTATNALQLQSFFPFVDTGHMMELKTETGKKAVLQVSSFLPKVDGVGHQILSANHDFIQDVLHNDVLTHNAKKAVILASIRLAQYGDDMGSLILQQYYNFVDASL
tara:strand:- start:462 stop:857 length:396 start_codon:yes stop_codon:yes gene_type:complete